MKRPSSRHKASFRPIIIGVNAAEDVIRNCLARTEPGGGYMHFPNDRDAGYFAQLTSERLVTKQVGTTRYRIWELPSGRANEALDCRVYAYAALAGLLHFGLKLNQRAETIEAERPMMVSPANATPAVTAATRSPLTEEERRRSRLSRLSGWKGPNAPVTLPPSSQVGPTVTIVGERPRSRWLA